MKKKAGRNVSVDSNKSKTKRAPDRKRGKSV